VADEEQAAEAKKDHEPPAGAETTAQWTGGAEPIGYTATAKWLVLRKKEKPSAEIFSVSYVADGVDKSRPVAFVFNGGPGASSAYLHMGAVGPQRVAFPSDGTLPSVPARLVQNDESWLRFTDLVFVDPVGTGFSRLVDKEGQPKKEGDEKKKGEEQDPTEYFGYKRTSSRCRSSSAAGSLRTAAGARLSSLRARATAAIASVGSYACFRRTRGSG